MKQYGVLIVLILLHFICFSQKKGSNHPQVEEADEHFSHGNYLMAIPIYKSELKQEPKNQNLKYKLGICYLNTRINREEALNYLLELSQDFKADGDVFKYLGKAYLLNNKIDEAIDYFKKYKSIKIKNAEEADLFIRQCNNAKQKMTHATNATFQNLGPLINSTEPDYYPFVNKDETFLVFTTRRKENIGGNKVEVDGYRSSDVYDSQLLNGKWSLAKNAGRLLNGPLDEQAVGLNAEGTEAFVYIDHIDAFGDLYTSKRKEGASEFNKAKILDKSVNGKLETSGCISEDGSVLFFARRDKLNENSDLYICRKLPTGKWALPQKLPNNINSQYNEDFPFLSYDEQTLYFSSDGLNSMGGYDLFKSTWDKNTNQFSEPENLGYPINSTDDDRSISVTKDNNLAYVSAFRPNGIGDLDIYRIKFNENEDIQKVYTGYIFLGDSIPSHQPKEFIVSIIVTNYLTSIEYTFVPNSQTGKYVMSLPSGLYKVEIFAEQFETLEEELAVSDLGTMFIENNKNFLLTKKSN